MISYDDDPDGYIRSLYRPEFGWHVDTISVRYESDNRADKGRRELVITNYDVSEVRALLSDGASSGGAEALPNQEGAATLVMAGEECKSANGGER